jgi:hypothetical protein
VPYFRNRPTGEDQAAAPLQGSQYDFWRSRQFRQANRIGPYPIMTAAQIRLLAAEGYFRQGNFVEMINRINVSRGRVVNIVTRRDTVIDTVSLGPPLNTDTTITDVVEGVNVLDTLPNTIADTLTPIPGGAGCVPRVPDIATNFQSAKCGSVWDALKWEYRMETAYTGYGNWYFASRGWGDLPEGTAIQVPVPYQEMDSRAQSFYPMGGLGGPGGAGRGNYGLFFGGVY